MKLTELCAPNPDGNFSLPLGLKQVNSMASGKVEVMDCKGLKIAISRNSHPTTIKAMTAMVHAANVLPDLVAALKSALPHYKFSAIMGDTESQAIAQQIMDALKLAETLKLD